MDDLADLTKARSMLMILLAACQQTLLALDAAAERARHGFDARPGGDDHPHGGRARRADWEDRGSALTAVAGARN